MISITLSYVSRDKSFPAILRAARSVSTDPGHRVLRLFSAMRPVMLAAFALLEAADSEDKD